jgi:hypothetical protein
MRMTGSWDEIEARRDEIEEAFLDLTVKASGVDASLADRARETFPYLVKVRTARPPGADRVRLAKDNRSWEELYAEFYRLEHDEHAPPELLTLLRDVLDETADATA